MTPRRLVHSLLAAALCVGAVTAVQSVDGIAPHAAAAPVTSGKSSKIRPRLADAVADQAQDALAMLEAAAAIFPGSSWVRYEDALDAIADQIAVRIAVDPLRLRAAWHDADLQHERALLAALGQLGVPYRHNASIEGVAFDCSGLTTYAWGRAGVTLTRQSTSQINAAAKRTLATAQAGDLVYYPGHVMMYLGVDAAIVHAPEPGKYVEVTLLKAKRVKTVRVGDPTA
jgi:cell wall-associated NlpC family hydrolase